MATYTHPDTQETLTATETNRFTNFSRPHNIANRNAPLEHQANLRWLEWFQTKGVFAVLHRSCRGYAVYRNKLVNLKKETE